MRWPVLALLLLVGPACATSLGANRAASVVPRGHVEAVGAEGISLPVGLAWGAVNDAVAIVTQVGEGVDKGELPRVDPNAAIRLGTAAAALLVQPPSSVQELNVRTGIWEGVDLGLRISGLSLRLDTGVQLHTGTRWKVLGTAGVARHFFGGEVLNFLSQVRLARFERTDYDAGVIVGREWATGAVYAGPKVIFSHFLAEGLLFQEKRIRVGPVEAPLDLGFELGNAWAYGGVAGVRVGWQYVFLTAELGIFGSSFRPRVLGRRFDLGGLIVFPSVGVVVRI